MKTLLIFTLIFAFAIPNQAQTRRTARAAATSESAHGQTRRRMRGARTIVATNDAGKMPALPAASS